MSHLLILSINYAPEPTGFAPHATALADHLVRRGHVVTVCTGFPFAPRWRRWKEYRRRFITRESASRSVIIRVTHFIPRRPGSAIQRSLMEGTFCLSTTLALLYEFLALRRRPDVVLYVGAQPAIAMLARLLAGLLRVPYFVNINDIASQAAVDVGIVRAGWVSRALGWFEFHAYAGASGATVLSSRFEKLLVANGYPADRIRLVRSPIDTEIIKPIQRTPGFRQRFGIPADAFVILFAGSMGLKQGLANVIDAADRSRHDPRPTDRVIQWVLVGDGETRVDIVGLIAAKGLEEIVKVLDFQPDSEMSAMFAAADVLLLNQVTAVKDSVIPSKMLTYMSAGIPILAAVNKTSEAASILIEAGGGVLVQPDDPAALARGAREISRRPPDALAGMGAANRAYAVEHFNQRTILQAHESFMFQPHAADLTRPATNLTVP